MCVCISRKSCTLYIQYNKTTLYEALKRMLNEAILWCRTTEVHIYISQFIFLNYNGRNSFDSKSHICGNTKRYHSQVGVLKSEKNQ